MTQTVLLTLPADSSISFDLTTTLTDPVPEPASIALIGMGGLAIAWKRRRNARAT